MQWSVPLKKKHTGKLGFTALETVEIVGALNILLADYPIHYQKMRNFHWIGYYW